MNIPPDLATLYADMVALLQQEGAPGIHNPQKMVRTVLKERLNVDWDDIIVNKEIVLTEVGVRDIRRDCEHLKSGMPVNRLYNKAWFYGLEFELSPATLDPRPETEMIVDLALKNFKADSPLRILDMGTGTGCLIVTLLKHFPKATGVATDILSDALATARNNAEKHNVEGRCTFLESHWWDDMEATQDMVFDLIVSNPPYIPEEDVSALDRNVLDYDPVEALDGGAFGLVPYENIFTQLNKFLKKDGKSFFEIGYDQGETVPKLAQEEGLVCINLHHDLNEHPRVVEIMNGDN